MSKRQLDEMQLQKRDKIGNQSFLLLFYLLMLDIGLNGFGVRWLSYPVNVFLIMLVCMGIYLMRVIWSNAYTGPGTGKQSIAVGVVFGGAALIAAVVLVVLNRTGIVQAEASVPGDNGAIILFVVSTVALLIAAIVSVINYRRNKADDKS